MGKVLPLTALQTVQNRDYNEGYSAGYNGGFNKIVASDAYRTGYTVGMSDKLEDLEAIESGNFDHMSESERELIYGDEKDRI